MPYLPLEDIDTALVRRSETTTHCPFKGQASYWSLDLGDRVVEDAVWAYEDPLLPEAQKVTGDVCFMADEVGTGTVFCGVGP